MIQMKIFFVIALLIGPSKIVLCFPSIGDIQEIANFANDAWGVLTGELPISALFTGSTGIMLDKILGAVGKISEKLDDVIAVAKGNSIKLKHMHHLIEKLMSELPREAKLDALKREFNAYIDRIDYFYNRFLHYSANRDNFNEKTIQQYVMGLTSFKRGDLPDVLNRMHRLFVSRSKFSQDTFLHMISSPKAPENNMCGVFMSANARLYNIYKILAITEIRSYVMTLFAFSIKKAYDNETFADELQDTKDQLIFRTTNLIESFKIALRRVPRLVRHCDIAAYEEDVTYMKFSNGYWNGGEVGHTFFMQQVVSNLSENMVLTGVRFVKENNLIQIQAREAQLLPHGNVNISTERWIPIPKIETRTDEKGVSRYYRLGSNEPLKPPYIFTLNTVNRSMYLDQVIIPPDRIITGIDLDDTVHANIFFDLRASKFDFNSGQLIADHKWMGYYTFGGSLVLRRYLNLNSKRNPVTAEGRKMRTDFLWFQFSETVDGVVAPFFDSRTVELEPRGPLSGIGLALRIGAEDAGIINFQVFSLDYAQYMNSTM